MAYPCPVCKGTKTVGRMRTYRGWVENCPCWMCGATGTCESYEELLWKQAYRVRGICFSAYTVAQVAGEHEKAERLRRVAYAQERRANRRKLVLEAAYPGRHAEILAQSIAGKR